MDRIETSLDRAARDAGRRMERQLNRAISSINPLRATVELNTQQAEAALGTLAAQVTNVRVMPEVDRDQFINAIQAALVGATVAVNVVPNMDNFNTAVRTHHVPDVVVNVRADTDNAEKEIGRFGKALGGLAGIAGTVAQIGALGTAAFGAASGVAALGAALAPAAGIIAAGPAVILGYQAALGGLKLALSGVSTAFGEALTGDAEKFNEALEDLSPKAVAAAREVRALKPAFEDLRSTVQDSFFSQITGEITKTAAALEGPLTKGLSNIAEGWGRAANNALEYIRGAQGVSNIRDILGASGEAIDGLALGTNKLTAGFLQIAASVSEAFGERFGGAIAGATEGIGTFLQDAAKSGRAVAWVEGALTVFKQLGAIVGNIGTILGTVFSQAAEAGGGLLARFEQMTGQVAEFVQSAEGTKIINSLFEVLSAVSGVLGQTFGALLTIVKAVAPAFTTIAGAITPILPVIGKLIGELASGLAPVIAQIAQVIGKVLAAALDVITPILPVIVDAFLKLVKAVSPLVPILGNVLVQAVNALWPLLSTLAKALTSIVTAVAPLITQLIEGLTPILNSIAPIFGRLVAAIAPLITQIIDALLPVLPPLIDAFLAIMEAVAPLTEPFIQLVEALTPLLVLVIQLIAPVIQLAAEMIKWLTLKAVVPMITDIINILTRIITVITDVTAEVTRFGNYFKANWRDIRDDVVKTITDLWNQTVAFFKRIWTDSTTWVSRTWTDVTKYFTNMYNSAVSWVSNIWTTVVQYFTNMRNGVVNALTGLVNGIGQKFNEAWSTAVSTVSDLVASVVRYFRDLPGRVVKGLGNLNNTLYSAGQNLLMGMVNGVLSVAHRLIDSVRNAVSDAYQSAKNFLGIRSPSRLFFGVGEDTGQGYVNGIDAMASKVVSAAEGLAASAVVPFPGSVNATVATATASPWSSGSPAASVSPFTPNRFSQALTGAATASRGGVTANFTINEVGDAEATAQRVLDRLVQSAGMALATA